MNDVIWAPDPVRVRRAQLTRYMSCLEASAGLRFASYDDLWEWSTANLEQFWMSLWEWFTPIASVKPTVALQERSMPGAVWFPGVQLNYARHLLRNSQDDRAAIVLIEEDGQRTDVSWRDLEAAAAGLRHTLVEAGVGRGDRVVGYVRNGPAAIVGLIACASLGAIWSSCAPDFATSGVVDRFGQLEPKVLLATDGYRFGGKVYDRRDEIEQISAAIPSIELIICERSADPAAPLPVSRAEVIDWQDATAGGSVLAFDDVPFDHPLWVLFSSGTTGKPKGIVQSHGGILMEHLKMMSLQLDMTEDDTLLIITSTTWMVWNILVAGLLVGAQVVAYDGNPIYPDGDRMWSIVEGLGVTVFGAGAAYLHGCVKAGLRPGDSHDLSALRTMLSTGSPLSEAAFDWVHDAVSADAWITSASGGTDVCTSFVGGCPLLPVRRGRIQAKLLGVDVYAFDEAGHVVVGEPGELIVRSPMPSMPIEFWGDADGTRYREAYFDTYPGTWRQGDFISFDTDGSSVIFGRSDATLNRKGVRIGTAEIYGAVESVAGVKEALVVGIELPGGDYYMPMFVASADDRAEIDDELREQIREAIVKDLSPRHVPDDVFLVRAVPHTKTGKKLEVPVKRLFLGAPLAKVCDPAAVDDFAAIQEINARAESFVRDHQQTSSLGQSAPHP